MYKTHQSEQSEQRHYANMIVVMISAEQWQESDSFNKEQTRCLQGILDYEKFKYKEATSMYKGVSESSFVVIVRDASELTSLKLLAKDFRQESILIRCGEYVDLYYPDTNKMEKIGSKIVQVSMEYALKQNAYTTMNDVCYIVK